MSIRRYLAPFLCGLIWLFNVAPTRGQVASNPSPKQREPVEDVVRINTRVVFVDTLVRDKKTGAPVTDLPLESSKCLTMASHESCHTSVARGLLAAHLPSCWCWIFLRAAFSTWKGPR